MRYKSSIMVDTVSDVNEVLEWAKKQSYKINNMHTSTGNHLMYEGYEDSFDYQNVLSYFKEHGFTVEIKGRSIVHSNEELEKAEILLLVVNAEIHLVQSLPLPVCSKCGMFIIPQDFNLIGQKIPKKDLVRLVGPDRIIVSDKIKKVLEESSFRGFSFELIEDVKGYYLLNVFGQIGEPTEKTPIKNQRNCSTCYRRVVSFSLDSASLDIHNVHFNRSAYDGSDFALPSTIFTGCPYFIVISNRVYQLLKKEKATGFYVIPAYLD